MSPQELLSHHENIPTAMWERRWADLVALVDYVEAHGAPAWYLGIGWGNLNRTRLAAQAQLQADGKAPPMRNWTDKNKSDWRPDASRNELADEF